MLQILKGRAGVGGQRGLHVPAGKHFFQNASIGGIVIHYQNRHILQIGGRQGNRPAGLRAYAEAHGEMESTALSDYAVKPEMPAKHVYQSAGNG